MRAAAKHRTPTMRDVAALSGGWPVPPWRPGSPFAVPPLTKQTLAFVAPTAATAAVVGAIESLMTVRLVNEMAASVIAAAGASVAPEHAAGHETKTEPAAAAQEAAAAGSEPGASLTGDEDDDTAESQQAAEEPFAAAEVPSLLASALGTAGEALRPVLQGDADGGGDPEEEDSEITPAAAGGSRRGGVEESSAAERAQLGAHASTSGFTAAPRHTRDAASARGRWCRGGARSPLLRQSAAVAARLERRLLHVAGFPGNPYVELMALGLGNILAGLLGGHGGCSELGLTVLNVSSGGLSRISGVTCHILVMMVAVFAAPAINIIPTSGLGAFRMFLHRLSTHALSHLAEQCMLIFA